MLETTQVLFNSPTLHSLKRQQLVKLCKIHSVRSTGKNAELVERLQKYAETLNVDAPSNVALGNHDESATADTDQMKGDEMVDGRRSQRPSEQWELLEDIEELEENSSQGTMSSLKTSSSGGTTSNDFGVERSRTTSVSSSIKALANTLGLQRVTSVKSTHTTKSQSQTGFPFPSLPTIPSFSHKQDKLDELAQTSIPYSALPPADSLPQGDHFKFSTPDHSFSSPPPPPVPGQTNRVGLPAPQNALLSSGEDGEEHTTTIRLVTISSNQGEGNRFKTPNLKPLRPQFELLDGGDDKTMWPASPSRAPAKLYPPLPVSNGTALLEATKAIDDIDMKMPGGLPVQDVEIDSAHDDKASAGLKLANESAPTDAPPLFVFGSPLPPPAFTFKTAAASVLEEMNKRLGLKGVEGVMPDLLQRVNNENTSHVETKTENETCKDKFDRLHQEEFDKMPSIADHYAARREKRKSCVLDDDDATRTGGAKTVAIKKSTAGARPGTSTRGISGVRKNLVVPGAFESGEEDTDLARDRRLSKRPRITEDNPQTPVETAPSGSASNDAQESKEHRVSIVPNDELKKQKEREAIKKKLELNKARRRSGRVSIGGKAPVPTHSKPANTRFGFLSSAKSIVQSVWKGVGAGASATQAMATKVGRVERNNQNGGTGGASHNARENGSSGNRSTDKSRAEKKIPPTVPVKNATSNAVSTRLPIMARSRALGHLGGTKAPMTAPKASSKSKSTVSDTLKSSTSTAKSATSTSSSLRSSVTDEAKTRRRVSSNGTMSSAKTSASGNDPMIGVSANRTKSTMSSLGTRTSRTSANNLPSAKQDVQRASSANDKMDTKKTSSRLLAPTASSLAKAQINRGSISTKGEPVGASSGADAGEEKSATPGPAKTPPTTLRTITNNPASVVAPPNGKVNKALSSVDSSTLAEPFCTEEPMEPKPPTLRGRVVPAKKPRISRSKVIAKLVIHRATSNAANFASSGSRVPTISSKTRSSIGAVTGGVKAGRISGGGAVAVSAKRRARQSEYARRRSGVAPTAATEHPEVNEA